MVRDLFTPVEASRVYSALALVTGLGPLLAPLAGGYILVTFGWRAIFLFLGGVTLVLLTIVHFRLRESQRSAASVEARAKAFSFGRIVGGYWRLLTDRHYIGYALCGAFALGGMFAYVSGGPFVFIELFHIPPQHFGWVFGGNAVILIVGAQVNGRIVGKVAPATLLRRANFAQATAGGLLLIHGLTGWGGLAGLMVPLGLFTACMGFIMSNATVLAMAPYGRIAGMASALLGTVQFGVGAAAASLPGAIHTGTALPMTAGMALCGLAGLIANLVVVKPRRT
jgi:DHA1 family bicyclomycin/chloramphenicol resistance-like MFS transporter